MAEPSQTRNDDMKNPMQCCVSDILARSVTDICSIIAHFPKTLAGQINPVLFFKLEQLGRDPYTLGPFL